MKNTPKPHLPKPQRHFNGGCILYMAFLTVWMRFAEAKLLMNLHAPVCPAIFVPISPTAEAIYGTAWNASILPPKKNSSSILRGGQSLES